MRHHPTTKWAVGLLLAVTAYGLVRYLLSPEAHNLAGTTLPFAVGGAVFLGVAYLWKHIP